MQWPIAENNPHNPRNIFAKRVCKLGKHCRNYKGKCHSVSKVLTATLITTRLVPSGTFPPAAVTITRQLPKKKIKRSKIKKKSEKKR